MGQPLEAVAQQALRLARGGNASAAAALYGAAAEMGLAEAQLNAAYLSEQPFARRSIWGDGEAVIPSTFEEMVNVMVPQRFRWYEGSVDGEEGTDKDGAKPVKPMSVTVREYVYWRIAQAAAQGNAAAMVRIADAMQSADLNLAPFGNAVGALSPAGVAAVYYESAAALGNDQGAFATAMMFVSGAGSVREEGAGAEEGGEGVQGVEGVGSDGTRRRNLTKADMFLTSVVERGGDGKWPALVARSAIRGLLGVSDTSSEWLGIPLDVGSTIDWFMTVAAWAKSPR